MSPPKVFSLAVVKGHSMGEVLRTDRRRISVGTTASNDLVVIDPNLAKRHFMVLIDQDRWKIHTYSPGESVTVDRRWTHPSTKKRGALVLAAGTEILLFPGDLEQSVIDAEIKKRITDTFPLPSQRDNLITEVFEQALEFDNAEIANEPTISMRMSDGGSGPTVPIDPAEEELVEMSMMPTITGARPPDDIREAARVRLIDERKPIAPSVLLDPLENQPVIDPPRGVWEEKTVGADPVPAKRRKRGTWDSAKKSEKRSEPAIPEVIAQPESQIMSLTRSTNSSMGAAPDFDSAPEAQVIELDSGRAKKKTNVWGDPDEQAQAAKQARSPKNAWGDPSEISQPLKKEDRPPAPPPPKKKNAWGDDPTGRNRWNERQERQEQQERQGRIEAPQAHQTALEKSGPRAMFAGRQLALGEVLKTSVDPALQIVREPDGAMATSIRLLGAKMEEFARQLGYRAYMFTSAEPLTGKTTTICNLAFALAEDTHRRVALVEANFRYPRFWEIFGLPEREGIIPVLEGRMKLSDSVVKVKDRNLVVLPTGGRHPHPAEVLASPRFKTMLAELADTVDIAVIDAPSTAPHADANLILPLVDAAFMVVADRNTRSIWLDRALAQLGEKRVLGALYNHIPKKKIKELKAERSLRSKLA